MTKLKISLRLKFITLTILIISLTTALVGSYIRSQLRKELRDQVKKRGIFIVKNLAKDSLPALLQQDDLFLLKKVNELKKEPEIVYAAILNLKGEVIVHSEAKEIGKIYESLAPTEALVRIEEPLAKLQEINELEEIYELMIPILSGKEILGVARIGLSLESVNSSLRSASYTMGGMIIFAIILGALLAHLFTKRMIRALEQIRLATEAAPTGTFEGNLALRRHDEIGEVARGLEKAITRLKENLNKYVTKEKGSREIERERLQALIDLFPEDGIAIADANNNVVLANSLAETIFEFPQGELVGKHLLDLLKDVKSLDLLRRARNNKGNTFSETVYFVGKTEPIKVKILVLDGEGELLGTVIVLRKVA